MPMAKSIIQIVGKMPLYPSHLAGDELTNVFSLGPIFPLLLQELQQGKPFVIKSTHISKNELQNQLMSWQTSQRSRWSWKSSMNMTWPCFPHFHADTNLPGNHYHPSKQNDVSKDA